MSRIFWKVLLLIAICLLWVWSFFVEPIYMLDTKEVDMVSPFWDKSLGTLRIGLLADFHAGAFPWEKGRISRAIDAANNAKCDIIFLLGDYLNGQPFSTKMDDAILASYIARLKAPLGVYAIYGNHDSYVGPNRIRAILEKAGAKILSNSNKVITTSRGSFSISGIMDPRTMPYSYSRAFSGLPKNIPCILLSHSPSVYYEIPRKSVIVFSGHTHGGQIRLPYIGAIYANSGLGRNFAEGRFLGNIDMYITRGLGTSRIPFRFLCPPEITVINLSGTLAR